MPALDTAADAPPHPLQLVLPPLIAIALAWVLYRTGADLPLFLAFNRLSLHTGPALWAQLTVLGDALTVMTLSLLLVGRRPLLLWAVIWASILCAVAITGVKDLVNTPRPPSVIPPGLMQLIGEPVWSFSFPSGHTAAAVVLATLLWQEPRTPAPLMAAATLMAALVGISRMAVGVHWPVDVLGGAAVGWLCAFGGLAIARALPAGLRPRAQRASAALLVVCAVWLFVHDSGYPQAFWLQRLVSVGCLLVAAPHLRRLFRSSEVSS